MDVKEYNVEATHGKRNHPWEYARSEVVMDLLCTVLERTTERINVVDVGCGDAFFLHQLSKRFENCNFFAVDTAFTLDTLTFFQEKYRDTNIKFYQNLSDLSQVCKKIDVVLLMDVIEHVEDDVALLSSLRMLPGFHSETAIAVTVPAYQSLFCSHDEWLMHYRRYSGKMLQQRLRQAGFTPMKSGYFFFTLLLPRILQKCKERFVKPNIDHITGIGNWNGSEFLSKILKKILITDYKFSSLLRRARVKLPGLSCYSISKPTSMLA
jgi:trans-aconitate methyltransferase